MYTYKEAIWHTVGFFNFVIIIFWDKAKPNMFSKFKENAGNFIHIYILHFLFFFSKYQCQSTYEHILDIIDKDA